MNIAYNEETEAIPKMKPMLFNTEMVRAILDGRKTVTRRPIKPRPEGAHHMLGYDAETNMFEFMCGNGGEGGIFLDWTESVKAPHRPGDILYVRETWAHPSEAEIANGADPKIYLYKADLLQPAAWDRWRPSIHMPKEAVRIFLRVTGVRVERLQDITGDDVCYEGAYPLIRCTHEHPITDSDGYYRDMCWNAEDYCKDCPELDGYGEWFGKLVWDSAIKPADLDTYGWEANPWVWVIEFEWITREEAAE